MISSETVDALLSELDTIARSFDKHEFGLPLYSDRELAKMRAAVLQWIVTRLNDKHGVQPTV
jgi:hypothetical protein